MIKLQNVTLKIIADQIVQQEELGMQQLLLDCNSFSPFISAEHNPEFWLRRLRALQWNITLIESVF